MSESNKKFYLTTPIYYVNARPHIGHAYSTIAADVIARRHRLLGDDTFFLTGTDEHGQKVQRSAAAAGIPPQQFTDEVSATFRDLWKRMGITNDDFIRTTDARHKRGVQKLWQQLQERGAIYLSSYTGQYSVGEEMFVDGPPGTLGPDGKPTETVTEENYFFRLSDYQLPIIDLIESGQFHIQPDTTRNEVLSFVRGNMQSIIREYLDQELNDQPRNSTVAVRFLTEEDTERALLAAEKKGLVRRAGSGGFYVPGALKDLSISRTTFNWGIPVPGNDKHVVYVWLDALANYMTAVGYGSDDPADIAKFEKYWPADLHLVGKEITRFHCVYWPAFLLALNPELQHTPDQATPTLTPEEHSEWAKKWVPKSVVANGWLLFEDSKMSKSRGNVVRTETILDAFGTLCPPTPALPFLSSRSEAEGSASPEPPQPPDKAEQDLFAADVLRYFLLREIPFGQDGSFSFDALVQRYNSDLANGYGNLVSRTLALIDRNFLGSIPDHEIWPDVSIQIVDRIRIGGMIGEIDPETFYTIPDSELSRVSKACMVFYAKAFEALRFSQGVDFEEAKRSLSHQEKIESDTLGILETVLLLTQQTDLFISKHAPWKLAKTRSAEDVKKLSEILYTAAESIRIITALLYPILPYATAKVWQQLGLGDIELAAKDGDLRNLQWGGLKPGTKLGPISPIFPRAPKELIQIMTDMESPNAPAPSKLVDEKTTHTTPIPDDPTHPGAPPRTSALSETDPGTHVGASSAITTERPTTPSHSEAPASSLFANCAAQSDIPDTPQIAIDDFVKIDLRVARILVAERIPKADKLLRLEVDLGYEKRQILSGIAEWYTPEELIGRRIVVIANLAPRKMRGLESHGMLLAASNGENGKPSLATFGDSEDIALGSRVR